MIIPFVEIKKLTSRLENARLALNVETNEYSAIYAVIKRFADQVNIEHSISRVSEILEQYEFCGNEEEVVNIPVDLKQLYFGGSPVILSEEKKTLKKILRKLKLSLRRLVFQSRHRPCSSGFFYSLRKIISEKSIDEDIYVHAFNRVNEHLNLLSWKNITVLYCSKSFQY